MFPTNETLKTKEETVCIENISMKRWFIKGNKYGIIKNQRVIQLLYGDEW